MLVDFKNFSIPGSEHEFEYDNETVIIFTRCHFVTFIPIIVVVALFSICPLILSILFTGQFNSTFGDNGKVAALLILMPYYLTLVTYFFTEWIDYYYDILVVTEKTLVNVTQKNIFSRDVAHVHLLQVEDISCSIHGILQSLFGYGDITIQTAGAEEHTLIRNVPDAQKITSLISEHHIKVLESRENVPVAEF